MRNRLYQKGNGIKILNFTMGSYFGVSDFVYNSPLYNGFINKWDCPENYSAEYTTNQDLR